MTSPAAIDALTGGRFQTDQSRVAGSSTIAIPGPGAVATNRRLKRQLLSPRDRRRRESRRAVPRYVHARILRAVLGRMLLYEELALLQNLNLKKCVPVQAPKWKDTALLGWEA
jgi:hypothetical protein